MFNKANASAAAHADHDDEPGSHNSGQSKRDDSNGSNQHNKKHRKALDAEISKGDIKMRAALTSYLSVSESDEETKQPRQSVQKPQSKV